MEKEEYRTVNGIPVDEGAHVITISEDTMRTHAEMTNDMWDGEENFYIDFFVKFLKSTHEEFGEYGIARALLEKGFNMLKDIDGLPTYNYESLDKFEEEFSKFMKNTREKDPYKEN